MFIGIVCHLKPIGKRNASVLNSQYMILLVNAISKAQNSSFTIEKRSGSLVPCVTRPQQRITKRRASQSQLSVEL